MSPTERTILTNFLLPPASLPSITTLAQFTSYFPRAQQTSPQIKTLYRDLQHQRAKVVDKVTQNVSTECKRGDADRREVVRARRIAGREEVDEEVEVEDALYVGQTSNLPVTKLHTLKSVLPEMEKSVEDIEEEIRRDEEEADALLAEIQGIIGGLSDLRYGRLANGQLRDQVIDGLARLESSCAERK